MNADEAIVGYREAIVEGNYEQAGECLAVFFRLLASLPEKVVMQREALRSLVNHAIGYCNAEAERVAALGEEHIVDRTEREWKEAKRKADRPFGR